MPTNASNNYSDGILGPFIPVNNDPNVVGSSTWNPWALYNGGGTTGGSSASGGSSGGGFWDWLTGGSSGGYDPSGGADDGGGWIYNGGYGGGLGGYGGASGGTGGGGSSLNPYLTGIGGLALGSMLSRGGSNASAVQRNLPAEVTALAALAPGLAGQTVGTQLQLNPLVTAGNVANFNYSLGAVAPALRAGYDAANPALAAYTQGLAGTLDRINGMGPVRYDPTGYQASISDSVQAGPAQRARAEGAQLTSAGPAAQAQWQNAQAVTAQLAQAQAERAAASRASGGPLLATLQQQAMQSVGGVSPLQARQQQIALGLLGGSGGDLTAQDLRNVQQDTRGAFAARGLYDSNQAIGAEIMNSDAARRQRLVQNLGIAQGVDAAGQQQISNTRNFALGVQNQGQNLSTFNTGQVNDLARFNAGNATNVNLANMGAANDVSKFNSGLLTQNNQFNSQGAYGASLANAQMQNQMRQFNAGQANSLAQYNAGLLAQNSQFNAGQANNLSQFNAGLGQQNLQFNAGQNNQASAFNAGVTNQANQWNAAAAAQNQNDQWARALQYGNFQAGQALNPTATAMGLVGQAPDYMNGLFNYGAGLNDFNGNAQSAANISRSNNNAALTAAGLNLLYGLYGRNGAG